MERTGGEVTYPVRAFTAADRSSVALARRFFRSDANRSFVLAP